MFLFNQVHLGSGSGNSSPSSLTLRARLEEDDPGEDKKYLISHRKYQIKKNQNKINEKGWDIN